MIITEVYLNIQPPSHDHRLLACCSVTFDDAFVVRDLKLISGAKGPFVAMPNRKLMNRCPQCGMKNHLIANYCNHCGILLHPPAEAFAGKLFANVAHPVNGETRAMLTAAILAEYDRQLATAAAV